MLHIIKYVTYDKVIKCYIFVYISLTMDRIRVKVATSGLPNPVFGKRDTCPIDQMPAKTFNLDPYTGRPMEEITRVMRCQTVAEQQTAFMNLVNYKGDFLPDETTAKEALRYMKPSLCQLPSELAEWQEALATSDVSKEIQKKRDEEDEEYRKQLEAKLADTPSVVESKPSES